jgi:hypothetical protein
MTQQGTVVVIVLLSVFVALLIFWWESSRREKRRRTLRREKDAGGDPVWVWVDYDGKERRSHMNPDERGGEWHTESGSFGEGGDGGD